MSWNNGRERKKFDAQQKKLAEEYAKSEMSMEQIQVMYEFDFDLFKRERNFCSRTQTLDLGYEVDADGFDDDKSALFAKFMDKLSTIDSASLHSRYWWIEEIEDPQIAKKLKELPEDELELLTLYAIDGFNQNEVGDITGLSQQVVSYRICKLKKYLNLF